VAQPRPDDEHSGNRCPGSEDARSPSQWRRIGADAIPGTAAACRIYHIEPEPPAVTHLPSDTSRIDSQRAVIRFA